jgi:hypothetical protein
LEHAKHATGSAKEFAYRFRRHPRRPLALEAAAAEEMNTHPAPRRMH